MIIAGIDAGIQNTKVVIMKDDKITGRAHVSSGGIDRGTQAQKAYDEALSKGGIGAGDVEKVIATGKGKYDLLFVDKVITETVAAARAARFYYPEATAVMSTGADETLAAALGEKRLIDEFALNQKCAAGLGVFLTYLARRLEMTMDEVSLADEPCPGVMADGCVVFSELSALSQLSNGVEPRAVMASANRAAATRAATVLKDLTASAGDKVVLIGGLTKNKAFVQSLEEQLDLRFLIPEDAEYCGAIGAVMSYLKGL
jgi:predicted CoA-substrate-specific enzyme activase